MGLFNTTKKVVKPFVNVPGWIGMRDLISWPKNIIGGIFRVMFRKTPIRQETFEEAIARLKLTEEDLKRRSKQLVIYAIIYASVAVIFLLYALLLLWWGNYKSVIVTMALSVAGWLLAYREHFRHFQMEQRRLGCTFKEWFKFYTQGAKKRSSTSEKK